MAVAPVQPEPEEQCDSEHLYLCNASNCSSAGGYWCNNNCISQPSENLAPIIKSFKAEPSSGEVPLTVYFTSDIENHDRSVVSFYIDYGDGNTNHYYTLPHSPHTYTKEDTFLVTLTVENDKCQKSDATTTVHINNVTTVESINIIDENGNIIDNWYHLFDSEENITVEVEAIGTANFNQHSCMELSIDTSSYCLEPVEMNIKELSGNKATFQCSINLSEIVNKSQAKGDMRDELAIIELDRDDEAHCCNKDVSSCCNYYNLPGEDSFAQKLKKYIENKNYSVKISIASANGNQSLKIPPATQEYIKSAGFEPFTIKAGRKEKVIFVKNQADWLIYTGHGSACTAAIAKRSDNNLLDNIFNTAENPDTAFYPNEIKGSWQEDLDGVMLFACGVLDINDYNDNYKSDYECVNNPENPNPGRKWLNSAKGPTIFLGYNYTAPLIMAKKCEEDINGQDKIEDWCNAFFNNNEPIGAWRNVAMLNNLKNEAAFDLRDGKYYYVNKDCAYDWRYVDLNSDTNSNGIIDIQEIDGFIDLDGNGVNDNEEIDEIKSIQTVIENKRLGLRMDANVKSIRSIQSISLDTISDDINKPQDMPFGLIDFELKTENRGDVATVVIHLSEPMPDNCKWYKHDSINGWQDYSDHADFVDSKTIVLTLQDGGIGDADGVANGIILDPSGLGIKDNNSDDVKDSGGGDNGGSSGCFIATAAYDSFMNPCINILCQFRDDYLLKSFVGKKFVEIYYQHSPLAANFISKHKVLKIVTRIALLPFVCFAYSTIHFGMVVTLFMSAMILISIVVGLKYWRYNVRPTI